MSGYKLSSDVSYARYNVYGTRAIIGTLAETRVESRVSRLTDASKSGVLSRRKNVLSVLGGCERLSWKDTRCD